MGGASNAKKHQFPSIVQVVWRSCSGDQVNGEEDCPTVRCGGSFINYVSILTAAHCVSNRYDGGRNADIDEVKVVAGTIHRIEEFELFLNIFLMEDCFPTFCQTHEFPGTSPKYRIPLPRITDGGRASHQSSKVLRFNCLLLLRARLLNW